MYVHAYMFTYTCVPAELFYIPQKARFEDTPHFDRATAGPHPLSCTRLEWDACA